MKLFLVRHAKTDAERNGFRQTPDIHLSDEGRKQALEIAKRLKKEKIEIVFSSPIARARETAEIIILRNKLPLQLLELVREREHDVELEGARIDGEINQKYFKELAENFNSFERIKM